MSVIAIDPGGITGIATYRAGNITSVEVPGAFEGFAEWASSAGKDELWVCNDIVIESFRINESTHKKDPVAVYETLDIIGAVRYLAFTRSLRYHTQTPGQAKGFATDANLRAMGWYLPSDGGHHNDARRHMLRFLANRRDPNVLRTLAQADD